MRKLASRGAGILMAGLILTSSACAHGQGAGTEPVRPNEAGGAVQLYVTNNSGGPMEVYAAGTGTLYRIGTVHPGLEGRFVVETHDGRQRHRGVRGPMPATGRSLRSGRILLVPRRRGGLRPHAQSGDQHRPPSGHGCWRPGMPGQPGLDVLTGPGSNTGCLSDAVKPGAVPRTGRPRAGGGAANRETG